MKKIILGILAMLFGLQSPAQTATVKTLIPHLQAFRDDKSVSNTKKLVVFDLDYTLAKCVWNYSLLPLLKPSTVYAVYQGQKSSADWLQEILTLSPVEEDMPALLQEMQDQNIDVIVLTNRTQDVAPQTELQFKDISFKPTNLTGSQEMQTIELDNDKKDPNYKDPVYINGVIYCHNAYNKGPTLVKFLEQNNIKKEKIIFADDKEPNVKSVNDALNAAYPNLQHISYHFDLKAKA